MSGLESKGDHSQRTLSNLLRREKVGHLFPEEQWRLMGYNIKHFSRRESWEGGEQRGRGTNHLFRAGAVLDVVVGVVQSVHLVLLIRSTCQHVRLSRITPLGCRCVLEERRFCPNITGQCKRRVSAAENSQLRIRPADVTFRAVDENLCRGAYWGLIPPSPMCGPGRKNPVGNSQTGSPVSSATHPTRHLGESESLL